MKKNYWLLLVLGVTTWVSCSNPVGTVQQDRGTENRSIFCYALPALIEAEQYTASSGIQTAYNPATMVSSVGWIDQGDWLDYPIYVPVEGEYTFDFRVASATSNGQFDVQLDGQTIRRTDSSAYWGIARLDVVNSGGWDNWYTLTMKAWLPQGLKTLRLWAGGKEFNIDSVHIYPTNGLKSKFTIPATIEPETFVEYQAMGNPLQVRLSEDGTTYVTMNYKSKFGTSRLNFTIDVPAEGTYQVEYRTASYYAARVALSIDQTVQSVTPLASTADNNLNWTTTKTSVFLTPGEHRVTLESYGESFIDGAPFSLDSVKFY